MTPYEAVLEALAEAIASRVAAKVTGHRSDASGSTGLTVRETAQRLGIGETKLRQLIREGSIRVSRVGRRIIVPESEVVRLLAGSSASECGFSTASTVVDLPGARARKAGRLAVRRRTEGGR